MNFDLTRSNLFATMFYSIVLLVVFWSSGSSLAEPSVFSMNADQTVVSMYLDRFIVQNPFLSRVMSASLAFVCSIMVARLAIRNVVFLERTYMPSMLFVIIASAFYNSGESLLPLLVSVLLIRAVSEIFKSYMIKDLASGHYLVIGFYFGLSAVLYPPSAYMAIMLYGGLASFRLGSFKEWVSATVGLLLPLSLMLYVVWFVGGDAQRELLAFLGELNWHNDIGRVARHFTLVDYTFVGTITLLVLLSVVVFIRSKKNYKLRSRLAYNYLFAMMLWTMVVMLVSPVRSLYMLPIAAIGASALIPAYFASRKPTFLSNFLYSLLILSAIAIHVIRF